MPPPYVFRLAVGHNFERRSVGFLEDPGAGELDAGAVFDGLQPKAARLVQTRFDHWIQGNVFQKYFHGFAGDYESCFVFKWEDRHKPQRLYGFLCHPYPQSNARFESCVLCYHDVKDDTTDYTILGWINRLRVDINVQYAIGQVYPELLGVSPWKN